MPKYHKILIAIASIVIAGCTHTPDRNYCIHSRGGLCRIPFDYLIFKDDLIKESVEISLTAFLHAERDGTYLYRSEEEFLRRNRTFALRIGNAQPDHDYEYLNKKYVIVTGTLLPSDGETWAVIDIVREPHERGSYIEESRP